MLNSPYYEDGDAQKQKHIYPPDFSLPRSMASVLDSQHIASEMGYSLECCQNAFMPQRFGIPWYSCPKCDYKKRPIPVNLDFVHLVEKWQQTDG